MKKQIEEWADILCDLTQEEADFIEEIIKWDIEKQAAFLFAKQIFEENAQYHSKENICHSEK